jgi:hypothetical protein
MYQRNPTTPEDEKRKADLIQGMAKEILQFQAVDRHEIFTALSDILSDQHKKDIANVHALLDEQSRYLDYIKNLTFQNNSASVAKTLY